MDTFATAYILEQRARLLKRRLTWQAFAAMAVPAIVGGLGLAYLAGVPALGVIVAVGLTLVAVQLVVSTWSLLARWVDGYASTIRSFVEHQRLARSFKELAEAGGHNVNILRRKYEDLETVHRARQTHFYGRDITRQEQRMGMRAALREMLRPCPGCGEIPEDLEPTGCDVCGKFSVPKF